MAIQRGTGGTTEGAPDKLLPPFALGGIALGMGAPFRISNPGEETAKGRFDPGRFKAEALRGGVAGINLRDGFGRFDQGAGGIEEKSADHGADAEGGPGMRQDPGDGIAMRAGAGRKSAR